MSSMENGTRPIEVLLLEDNAGDARLVRAALADHAPGEFAVTGVERLADALARIESQDFDVVLSDLGLPDSTGLATAQAIAVIIVSQHAARVYGEQARAAGAFAHIAKEKVCRELLPAVSRALDRRRSGGGNGEPGARA